MSSLVTGLSPAVEDVVNRCLQGDPAGRYHSLSEVKAAFYAAMEDAGELTINGTGLHLGLAKVVNGAELAAPGDAPASIIYQVETLDAETLVVTIEAIPGNWWTFRFKKAPVSPLLGSWKLDGEGSAGVGPAAGDVSWWSLDAAGVVTRACWLDDVYEFNADGSFRNIVGDETWLEPFQGVGAESCGAPVAPPATAPAPPGGRARRPGRRRPIGAGDDPATLPLVSVDGLDLERHIRQPAATPARPLRQRQ